MPPKTTTTKCTGDGTCKGARCGLCNAKCKHGCEDSCPNKAREGGQSWRKGLTGKVAFSAGSAFAPVSSSRSSRSRTRTSTRLAGASVTAVAGDGGIGNDGGTSGAGNGGDVLVPSNPTADIRGLSLGPLPTDGNFEPRQSRPPARPKSTPPLNETSTGMSQSGSRKRPSSAATILSPNKRPNSPRGGDCLRCLERDDPDTYYALHTDATSSARVEDNQITNSNAITTMADARAALLDSSQIEASEGKHVPSYAERSSQAKLPDRKRRALIKNVIVPMVTNLVRRLVPGKSQKDVMQGVGKSLSGAGGNAQNDSFEPKYKRLLDSTATVMLNSKKGSVEKRVSRSILVHGVATKDLGNYEYVIRFSDESSVDDSRQGNEHSVAATSSSSDGPARKKKSLSIAGPSRAAAVKDYGRLANGEGLINPKYSRSRVPDSVVSKAVKFVISKQNVSPLSWGERSVKLSKSETVTLPKLSRQRGRDQIWAGYVELTRNNTGVWRSYEQHKFRHKSCNK